MDSPAIPANARNVEGALKLIDFLLRPEIAVQVAETIGYPTPNPGGEEAAVAGDCQRQITLPG